MMPSAFESSPLGFSFIGAGPSIGIPVILKPYKVLFTLIMSNIFSIHSKLSGFSLRDRLSRDSFLRSPWRKSHSTN
jgi:hypothetical protein